MINDLRAGSQRVGVVQQSLMPKGVEHMMEYGKYAQLPSAAIFDAERR